MRQAWPRFLPRPIVEAISHALIIEASVIATEAWGDGHSDLFKAHKRAEIFARARCSEDEIPNALTTCAALPGNENLLLHHVMCFLPAEIEIHADTRPGLRVVATSDTGVRMLPRVPRHRTRRQPAAARQLALAARA